MRIAILTELYPPSVGGQEIRFAEIAEVLIRHGHSVDIFCNHNIPGSEPEEIVGSLSIHRSPTTYSYQNSAINWFRRDPLSVLRYAIRCRHIPPEAFDLFIFNQWPLAHILLASRKVRAKAVIDWCEFRNGLLFAILQKYLPRLAFRNIANSLPLKHKMEQLSGCAFECLPSGIHLERYRSAPAASRSGLLFLGRVTEHKNLPLMLSSYECLLGKGYTGRLRITGNGPAMSHVREIITSLGIEDKVDMLGFVTEEQKVELLSSSEVLVLTSWREGFPRVIAEAMASGLPVVTVDFPGNGAKDIVRQYRVGVVTQPSSDRLSDGILRTLNNWKEYSEAALSARKTLDWEVLVGQLLRLPTSRPTGTIQ